MSRFQRPADAPPEDQTEQFEVPEVSDAPVYAPVLPEATGGPEEPGYDEPDYEPLEWEPREPPRPVGERFAEFRLRVTRALHGFERGRVDECSRVDEPADDEPAAIEDERAYDPAPAHEVVAEVPPRTEDARFPHAPLGYNRTAVDERIAELEAELEELRDSRPEVSITDEIERLGDQTASILVVAHDQAHETTRMAQEKADRRIAEAEAHAEALTEAAKRRLSELDGETDAVWRERARLLEDARSVGLALIALAEEAAERFVEDSKTVEVPAAETSLSPPAFGAEPPAFSD